jgi:hypothetical protein
VVHSLRRNQRVSDCSVIRSQGKPPNTRNADSLSHADNQEVSERFGVAHRRTSLQSVALARIRMRREVLIFRQTGRLMAKSSLDILGGSARCRRPRSKRASLAEHRDSLWLSVLRCTVATLSLKTGGSQTGVESGRPSSAPVSLTWLTLRTDVRLVENGGCLVKRSPVLKQSERRCCWTLSLAVNPGGCLSGLQRFASISVLSCVERSDCFL